MNDGDLHWNGASLYWLAWFVGAFLGPELYFLFTNPHNTLSYQVWHLEGLTGRHVWTFARYCVAAGCVWLAFHFTFGWFRG